MVEYLIIAALVIALIAMICFWPRIETIKDDAPEHPSKKNGWLKLQNEGQKYIKYKDGKVYLKIVK